MSEEREKSAEEIIAELGERFEKALPRNRREAWRGLLQDLMLNLSALARSRMTQSLRDMIAIAMDIDKNVLGGAAQGSVSEPLDVIAERWTMQDDEEDGGNGKTGKN